MANIIRANLEVSIVSDKSIPNTKKTSFTFFGTLKPFDEFAHLLKEDRLALDGVGFLVPLDNYVFRQNIG